MRLGHSAPRILNTSATYTPLTPPSAPLHATASCRPAMTATEASRCPVSHGSAPPSLRALSQHPSSSSDGHAPVSSVLGDGRAGVGAVRYIPTVTSSLCSPSLTRRMLRPCADKDASIYSTPNRASRSRCSTRIVPTFGSRSSGSFAAPGRRFARGRRLGHRGPRSYLLRCLAPPRTIGH